MFIDLNNVEEQEPFEGATARIIHSKNMTFVEWRFKDGAELPAHNHPHEQIVSIIEGKLELTIGEETKVLMPGMVAVIPSNEVHSGRAITDCRTIDIFHPTREDYR